MCDRECIHMLAPKTHATPFLSCIISWTALMKPCSICVKSSNDRYRTFAFCASHQSENFCALKLKKNQEKSRINECHHLGMLGIIKQS